MKCRLIRELRCVPNDRFPEGRLPIGTEIEDPKCWVHIRMGQAEPADEEAEEYRQTPEEQARAQHVYLRTVRGIHPDDFPAYEAGDMIGYNAEGDWIPGPNALADRPGEDYEEYELLEET